MPRFSFLGYQKSFTRKPSFNNKLPSRTTSSSSFNQQNNKASFHPNMQEMKRVFDKYDANKDGKISLTEYRAALRWGAGRAQDDEAARRAFEVADKDGDGFIDFEEFLSVNTAGGGVSTADIGRAFRAYDLDGDGRISAEEVAEVMKRIGGFGGEEWCGLEACRRMVKAIDKDGDGLIDLEEFTAMMTRTMKMVSN